MIVFIWFVWYRSAHTPSNWTTLWLHQHSAQQVGWRISHKYSTSRSLDTLSELKVSTGTIYHQQNKLKVVRVFSTAEPVWMFTHTRHSNDRGGGGFFWFWPLSRATGPLCAHYQAHLVNVANHLWLSTDSGLVMQQRQRSFFIMWYDIVAWIVGAVCRGSDCAHSTGLGEDRGQ